MARISRVFSGLCLIIMLIVVATGCATKVRVQMLQPAKFHEASLTKAVAVLPFSGHEGHEFASEIESVISGVNIDGKPYFNLVDRTILDKAISEMKLSTSGLVDPSTAIKLGKMVAAQGIYTGVVTGSKTRDQRYTERREECERYQRRYNSKTKEYEETGRCASMRRWTVQCLSRTANFSATPKLISVETGKVLYAQNLSGTSTAKGCEDTTLPSDEITMLSNAKSQVLGNFRKDIAPYPQTHVITLLDTTKNIEVSVAKDKLKEGINWADKGRLDTACLRWGEAHNLCPDSPALLYNLGVCAESRAELQLAQDLYKKADQRLGKPDDDVTLALSRVSIALKNQKKLQEQMSSKSKE